MFSWFSFVRPKLHTLNLKIWKFCESVDLLVNQFNGKNILGIITHVPYIKELNNEASGKKRENGNKIQGIAEYKVF